MLRGLLHGDRRIPYERPIPLKIRIMIFFFQSEEISQVFKFLLKTDGILFVILDSWIVTRKLLEFFDVQFLDLWCTLEFRHTSFHMKHFGSSVLLATNLAIVSASSLLESHSLQESIGSLDGNSHHISFGVVYQDLMLILRGPCKD